MENPEILPGTTGQGYGPEPLEEVGGVQEMMDRRMESGHEDRQTMPNLFNTCLFYIMFLIN